MVYSWQSRLQPLADKAPLVRFHDPVVHVPSVVVLPGKPGAKRHSIPSATAEGSATTDREEREHASLSAVASNCDVVAHENPADRRSKLKTEESEPYNHDRNG